MATPAGARTLIGAKVGNYEVVSTLGEGGMGVVYLAEHPMIGKRVAIKVLHPDAAARADAAARCFLEARAVNEIHHANVVDIIDCGVADVAGHGQVHYLLMEYLEGESLRAVLRRGALPPARATKIALEVARALEAAHERAIVHRDIKPENIFLVRDDDPDAVRVKVLDFGIAKLTDGHPFKERLTQSGVTLGTPQYMAPEQLDAEDVDGRADVYALGITLYEMLCGAAPFAEETTARGVWRRMNELPVMPDSVAAPLPAGLQELVLRTLDPSRARRPSMADVVTALADPAHRVPDVRESGPHTVRIGKQPTRPVESPERDTARSVTPPARPRWIVPVVIGAAAFGSLVVWRLTRRAEPAQPALTSVPPAVVPDAAPVAVQPDAYTAPLDLVAIAITTTPVGAEVIVEPETAPRGVTPTTIELPRHTGAVVIRIRLAGYRELRRSVQTLRDHELDERLQIDPGRTPAVRTPHRTPVDAGFAPPPVDAAAPASTPRPDAGKTGRDNLIEPSHK